MVGIANLPYPTAAIDDQAVAPDASKAYAVSAVSLRRVVQTSCRLRMAVNQMDATDGTLRAVKEEVRARQDLHRAVHVVHSAAMGTAPFASDRYRRGLVLRYHFRVGGEGTSVVGTSDGYVDRKSWTLLKNADEAAVATTAGTVGAVFLDVAVRFIAKGERVSTPVGKDNAGPGSVAIVGYTLVPARSIAASTGTVLSVGPIEPGVEARTVLKPTVLS